MILQILGILHIASGLVHCADYPGTETRPILSETEASKYTIDNYLNGWEPEEINLPDEPDYVIEEGQSIQAVVNEAIKKGNSATRVYIKIESGHYMETVYIKGDVPLTIYGDPDSPSSVHIMSTLSAETSVADYISTVNKDGLNYQQGDPAWDLYNECATKQGIIQTNCTAVLWITSNDFQLEGVTVHNGATDFQAVAVRTAADRLHLMNNIFMSVQDTLALGIDAADDEVIQRVLVHMCQIFGEADFVFGGAQVVFNMDLFFVDDTVEKGSLIVFAPDTSPERSYGFLVINSNITGSDTYDSKVKLARAWDRGITSPDNYVAGKSPNGQLVIRETNIGGLIDIDAPYAAAATSLRPFTTDISADRDLDDNIHNRLWEYNNYGDGW